MHIWLRRTGCELLDFSTGIEGITLVRNGDFLDIEVVENFPDILLSLMHT